MHPFDTSTTLKIEAEIRKTKNSVLNHKNKGKQKKDG
jgi:hypothetical protein